MSEARDFEWMKTGGVAALVRPGTGGTVVIVPGAMTDAQGWLPFATMLETTMAVAIVNRRGRAPSDSLPKNFTVADEVADVRAVLSSLQRPFFLVGWSYGALLAMEAAIDAVGIVSIVLYEPVCRPFASTAIETIRQTVASGDLDHAVELVITKVSGASAEQVAALRKTHAWAYLMPLVVPAATELSALNDHRPNFPAYAAISAPVTVLVGSVNEHREPYGTAADRFLAALPNARRIVLHEQGHLAHSDAPALLAEVVRAALSA